jgi:hypothetical protein
MVVLHTGARYCGDQRCIVELRRNEARPGKRRHREGLGAPAIEQVGLTIRQHTMIMPQPWR